MQYSTESCGKYRLVVFDLDDTLAAVGKSILECNVNLLKEITKTGAKIAICSGKPVYYLCGFMRQVGINDAILVGENGGVIQFGVDLPPVKFLFSPHCAEADNEIAFLKQEFDKILPDTWYQPNQVGLTPFPKNDEEFEIFQRCIDENKENIKHLTVYRHCDSIDITPSGITKYTGLEYLGRVIGIKPDETIAVGDGVNDYPMFKYAGYTVGVNVKNAEAVRVNFRTINEALQHILNILM